MKAVIINKWGGPEVLEYTDIEAPHCNNNQLLIEVYASAINPVDWKHRIGFHKYMLGAPFPIVLGYDVCGKVIEVGSSVSQFKIGDIVFGDLDIKYGGGYAEYAIGSENCFALKPNNCSNEETAAYPLVSLTALQALRDKAELQAEQTIIINGAAGGVGHIAIQIAKIMGAHVIAIASGKNKDFVLSLGADEFFDYTKDDISHLKADVFFDVKGNYSFPKTLKNLNPRGTYINPHPRFKILFHKILERFTKVKKVKTLLRKHSMQDMKQIAQWISEEKLQVHIDKSFPLSNIQEAHSYAEKGRTVGKNVILIKEVEF